MYRGLIHFHSKYSYDSILSIDKIVDFAIKENLNFLVLTDHESIEGSLALKDYISQNNYDIKVIIAAEYNTSYGDIIALNIYKEIKNMEFDSFIEEVKKQKGLILFPHPYKGHKNINYIASKVDFIEVFNSRTDDMSNDKAFDLANRFQKNVYYASDAHNYNSLGNSIIEFEKVGTFLKSLRYSKITQSTRKKTYYMEVFYSQIIKSFKNKNIRLLINLLISFIKSTLKMKLFQRI